tara:strand:+ start:28 stop:513 length:486 start_codon:yes stop_codon:yes gene_type:complete
MIDISSATLDVIEAVKTQQVVKFDYGHDVIRKIKPTGFFGDFDGFEGTDESTEDKEFRRFRFDKIQKWIGVRDKFEEIDNLKIALSTAIDINKEAKGLSYPIVNIQVKLSGLAEKHGLEEEMEYYLDQVNEASRELESRFYECESVFKEAISELELEEDDD